MIWRVDRMERVCDRPCSKLHLAVKDGKASIFAESEELEHPNGILVDGDSLILGGWGRDLQPTSPPKSMDDC